ncbi:chaoptin isoform X1 [Diabrotica virgifera virgifera]|uniref:Chaoptin n=1 Tax=Diabrotica virgifera virgifera TaxID=50390 RepID=A0ABM5JKQ3_DIAVI|nr:chaoptin isoform X1 [Diabrotica virgifera virgifera]
MDLLHIMKFGYAVVIGSIIIMIWISMIESKQVESVIYPPCFFNPLCSCSKSVPDLGIVRCQDVHLPRIPETVNTSKVFMLHMENNEMRTLEPYFLQSTGLYKIIISENPLSTITDEAFIGLERSLWELEISHCHLTIVPNRAIRYLQKLRRLDLTGNDINKISPENWRGIEHSLEVLVLAENDINHIPIDTFSGLPNLDTIDLRGNNLREIDPSVFRDGLGRLAYLILADNQLSSIPYQALQPLRLLKTLDLSFNRINKMQPATEPGVQINLNYQLNLDTFRLDYNQISFLEPMSFQYFNVLNRTYLDGNPITNLEENAFRQAKIKELYLRSCGLTQINPAAFEGLEKYLEILDLSGNNISLLPEAVFHPFQLLRSLSLRDNILQKLNPIEDFNGFQFTLYNLDLSGNEKLSLSLQDLRRLRSLRSLSMSKLTQPTLSADNFLEFGIDLEELKINFANLQTIKNNAFQHVHGLKSIDLSENAIGTIENNAFTDIDHSLTHLKISHGLSSSLANIPADAIKVLTNLKELDLSNNKLKMMPDTSFHSLRQLQKLELQDNTIDVIHKGTFQGDIHEELEEIYLSFNSLKTISQHTFVHLPKLEQLLLDDNKIESLERRAFMNLENIKRLNLKGNKISSISLETFQNLPELEDLDMSYNKIKTFEFTMFDQVGTLSIFCVNISHNSLTELLVNVPSTFEGAVCSFCEGIGSVHSNIKLLDLSYNNISAISKQFFRPVELSLTHLYLSHNNLLNASRDVFGSLRHLQWLDISYNGMYEMDFDMFRNTKKLQVLLASHNKIADVANDLFRFLSNLRIVDLSHNRLRALPDNLFREEGLEKLDLSHNMLSKLPLTSMSVSTAITVCELDLSWNSISSLSHGGLLTRFRSLNFLDLSYNRLASIDAGTFKGLPKLSALDLSHNSQLVFEPNGLSFQGLEYTLYHLQLNNISLSQVPTLPTPHLISLSLSHNSLPTVPPEMTTNLTKLQRLNLDHNDLTAIPIVTHQLDELRYFSIAGNPVTFLSNTSLLGVADHLVELDIKNLELNTLETGVFCKMYSLRTLEMDQFPNIKNLNIPSLLQFNTGLRNLEIHVEAPTDDNLEKQMSGELPLKLRNITFTGKGLKKLGGDVLNGIRSPVFHFGVHNTSIMKLAANIFDDLYRVKNLTVDVRENQVLQNLLNPSRGHMPNLYGKTFLIDLDITGNKWTCDCDLGWVEVWLRKRRQYLCGDSPPVAASFTDSKYTCRHVDDDLRTALCHNKNNQTVIDVLKSDIECGWSFAPRISTLPVLVFVFIVSTLQLI